MSKSNKLAAAVAANLSTQDASGATNPNDPHVIAARNVRNASGALDGALVDALRVAARNGAFAASHLEAVGYSAGSAKTFASEWNVAATLASIIGEAGAIDAIDAACKATPADVKRYAAIRDTLRKVRDAASEARTASESKTVKPAQVRAIVKAVPVQAAATVDKMRDARTKPKGPAAPSEAANRAAKLASASGSKLWMALASEARMLSIRMHEALKNGDVPEGHESACKGAADAMADAAEGLAPFLRSVSKA